jgi:hypothetical protein
MPEFTAYRTTNKPTYNNNNNIHLLIQTDKYAVRLHDGVVTDDNKLNRSRI